MSLDCDVIARARLGGCGEGRVERLAAQLAVSVAVARDLLGLRACRAAGALAHAEYREVGVEAAAGLSATRR